jgi:CMP-N-acetylneuraminic acid synthetase
MNVYGLSTARAGSKSVVNKNVMIIKEKPLYLHNLLESLATPDIKATYITTDIKQVIDDASKHNYKVIIRPDELCQDASTHTDTIYHGLLEIERLENTTVDILVIMLGNTMNMDRNIVKQALTILNNDVTLDSVITVIKANHFNPLRAYIDDGNGYITTYLPQSTIIEKTTKIHLADKNSQGNILFQNGLWIVRRQAIIDAKLHNIGLQPFNWFGQNIRYLEQDPRLQEIDDAYQVRLLI